LLLAASCLLKSARSAEIMIRKGLAQVCGVTRCLTRAGWCAPTPHVSGEGRLRQVRTNTEHRKGGRPVTITSPMLSEGCRFKVVRTTGGYEVLGRDSKIPIGRAAFQMPVCRKGFALDQSSSRISDDKPLANFRRLSWCAYQGGRIWQAWLSRRDPGSRHQCARALGLRSS